MAYGFKKICIYLLSRTISYSDAELGTIRHPYMQADQLAVTRVALPLSLAQLRWCCHSSIAQLVLHSRGYIS